MSKSKRPNTKADYEKLDDPILDDEEPADPCLEDCECECPTNEEIQGKLDIVVIKDICVRLRGYLSLNRLVSKPDAIAELMGEYYPGIDLLDGDVSRIQSHYLGS